MKTFDFYSLYRHIRQAEVNELKRILNKLGGKYHWKKGEGPVVLVNDGFPEDMEIQKVSLTNGRIELVGLGRDSGELCSVDIDDIQIGHLSFVSSELPVQNLEDNDETTADVKRCLQELLAKM